MHSNCIKSLKKSEIIWHAWKDVLFNALKVRKCGFVKSKKVWNQIKIWTLTVTSLGMTNIFYLTTNLPIWTTVDPIVVDPAVEAYRYRELTGTALAVANQKAAIDPAAEEVFGGVPRDGAVVPRVLLQAVGGGDVRDRNPSRLVVLDFLHLTPLPTLIVAEDPHLVTWGIENIENHLFWVALRVQDEFCLASFSCLVGAKGFSWSSIACMQESNCL